jgi:hypothetical protein
MGGKPKKNRRQFIKTAGAVGVVSFAGCASESTGTITRSNSEVKSASQEYSYDNLMRNTDRYTGSFIHIPEGRIAQVLGDSEEGFQFRVQVDKQGNTWENDILIRSDGERFLKEDIIEAWGRFEGLVPYETVLGNDRTIPEITGSEINLLQKSGDAPGNDPPDASISGSLEGDEVIISYHGEEASVNHFSIRMGGKTRPLAEVTELSNEDNLSDGTTFSISLEPDVELIEVLWEGQDDTAVLYGMAV